MVISEAWFTIFTDVVWRLFNFSKVFTCTLDVRYGCAWGSFSRRKLTVKSSFFEDSTHLRNHIDWNQRFYRRQGFQRGVGFKYLKASKRHSFVTHGQSFSERTKVGRSLWRPGVPLALFCTAWFGPGECHRLCCIQRPRWDEFWKQSPCALKDCGPSKQKTMTLLRSLVILWKSPLRGEDFSLFRLTSSRR